MGGCLTDGSDSPCPSSGRVSCLPTDCILLDSGYLPMDYFTCLACPTLFRTGTSRHPIAVAMADPSSVGDFKVIVTQSLQPSCCLALWLLKVEEPAQCSVICSQQKPSPQQVASEMSDEVNYCQEFSSCYAIVAFTFGKDLAPIGYYFLLS